MYSHGRNASKEIYLQATEHIFTYNKISMYICKYNFHILINTMELMLHVKKNKSFSTSNITDILYRLYVHHTVLPLLLAVTPHPPLFSA